LEDAGGARKRFFLRVTGPIYGNNDYYCRVHAPALIAKDADIYGVDAEQARVLAIDFAKSLLEGKKLINGRGVPIEL
jgi:hypothetical protein